MQNILYITAALIAAVTLWDAFITVFSSGRAGFLTRFWIRRVWKILLALHRRRPIHRLLALAGPFFLLAGIIVWYTLLAASFFLLVAADQSSVVNASTDAQVGLAKRFYFVITTITSIGYGDLVPARFPWTLLSGVATFAATAVLTISLSYVLAVLGAAIERRSLAQGIFGLGATPSELIKRGRLDDAAASLKNHFLQLTSQLDSHSHKHLAYPILHFFHSPQADRSPARAILLLADAFFLQGLLAAEQRPPAGLLHLVESSINNYAEMADFDLTAIAPEETHPGHLFDTALALDIPAEEAQKGIEEYMPLRRRLTALCRADGWNGDEK